MSAQRSHEDEEQQALLGHRHSEGRGLLSNGKDYNSEKKGLRKRLTTSVDSSRADVPLILSFFIAGMIDAGSYNAYECFCSMQTGNTVLAALGVSDLPAATPKLAWVKSLTSVFCYVLGSVCIASLHRYAGQRKRWVLSLSFLIQMVFIAIASVMVRLGKSSGSPVGGGRLLDIDGIPADPGFPWLDLLPIGLLSFQAAGKVVASRMLEQSALPVVVLTTLYSDLVSDPTFFSAGLWGNVQRNRRISGVVFYFVGAVFGGVAASHSIGFSGGLAIAAAIQFCVAIAWLAWPAEKQQDDEE